MGYKGTNKRAKNKIKASFYLFFRAEVPLPLSAFEALSARKCHSFRQKVPYFAMKTMALFCKNATL
jgi:hypothetical protein